MNRTWQLWLFVFCMMMFQPVRAEPIRQLSWGDLIPPHSKADDVFSGMTQDQRDMVNWVIGMLESLPDRGPDTEEFYEEVDNAMPMLEKAGIDIVSVMAKRKEMQTAVVEDLDGRRIRIPGYLLPLEMSEGKVHEFLLVPYVGACIHVPPPPPNQIVYVKVGQKGGYKNEKLYDPVWVTGTISARSMNKELFLVDGSAGIDIGYSMQANLIEPYK